MGVEDVSHVAGERVISDKKYHVTQYPFLQKPERFLLGRKQNQRLGTGCQAPTRRPNHI